MFPFIRVPVLGGDINEAYSTPSASYQHFEPPHRPPLATPPPHYHHPQYHTNTLQSLRQRGTNHYTPHDYPQPHHHPARFPPPHLCRRPPHIPVLLNRSAAQAPPCHRDERNRCLIEHTQSIQNDKNIQIDEQLKECEQHNQSTTDVAKIVPIIKKVFPKAKPKFIPRQVLRGLSSEAKVKLHAELGAMIKPREDNVNDRLRQQALTLRNEVRGPILPPEVEVRRQAFKNSDSGNKDVHQTVLEIRKRVLNVCYIILLYTDDILILTTRSKNEWND